MGRPKSKPEAARDHRLQSRYTDDEIEQIRVMAERAGISRAEFQRRASLGQNIETAQSPEIGELIRELNRVGINFNQVQKKLNATGIVAHDIRQVIGKIDTILDKILPKL